MPKLTVDGYGTFDVPDNKRLVLAIEQDAKVDILHACGGNARCTTCRVEFIDGEPAAMTAAEKERLEQRGLSGVRLSCQIVCDHDMSVRAISRLEGSGRPDPGRTPEETHTTAACVDLKRIGTFDAEAQRRRGPGFERVALRPLRLCVETQNGNFTVASPA